MLDVSSDANELQRLKILESRVEVYGDKEPQFVRDYVTEFLKTGTQKTLAKQAGISSPTLNLWMHGKYKGNNEVVLSKLVAWAQLRIKVGDMKVRAPAMWVETPTSRRIFDAITYARARHTIGLVFGGAGVGKTTSIQQYADSYPNVWVWTASPACSAMLYALRDIRTAIGGDSSGYQRQHIVTDIMDAIQDRQGVLVVDEAQHLKVEVLDQIRSLYDASDLGLVFSGNEKILSRMGGGGKAEFAQITSRVGRHVRIDAPTPEDVAAILEAWEVVGAKELDYSCKLASLHGGLRVLDNVLHEAALISDGMGIPIDLKSMRMAHESLGEMA